VEFSADLSPSTWIAPRLLPWGQEQGTRVASVVPTGYPAYVRVLHPASRREEGGVRPVGWREVAAWSGRVYHPLAQYDRLTEPVGTLRGPAPMERPPETGRLPEPLCERLFQALSGWTATPGDCWLGIWEGWGSLGYPDSISVIASATDSSRLAEAVDPVRAQLAEVAERARQAPRFAHPHRRYLLAHAPAAAACELAGFPFRITPSLAWPADRSWCLGTAVDFDSTLVAADDACAAALLADDRFEAMPVDPEGRLDIDGDLLNQPDDGEG